MARKGKLPTDVKALCRVHTETMLNVLRGIATNPECPPAARATAAIYVINRGWGQPHQSIDMTAEVVTTKVIRTPTPTENLESWKQQFAEPSDTLQ